MRIFRPDDLVEINGWLRARGLEPWADDCIPCTGLIEPGVAAGFLLFTDATAVALLDGFVSNRDAAPGERDAALRSIGEALLEVAQERGIRRVVAWTRSGRMLDRAVGHGFKVSGHSACIEKEL